MSYDVNNKKKKTCARNWDPCFYDIENCKKKCECLIIESFIVISFNIK